jgi:S1-C subfamily serine protease
VLAIGSPCGLGQPVTSGIISAKARGIGAAGGATFLQTDASINPGNSGGPLVNVHGQVIGINSLIVGRGQGIGFAIPSNMAVALGQQIIAHPNPNPPPKPPAPAPEVLLPATLNPWYAVAAVSAAFVAAIALVRRR